MAVISPKIFEKLACAFANTEARDVLVYLFRETTTESLSEVCGDCLFHPLRSTLIPRRRRLNKITTAGGDIEKVVIPVFGQCPGLDKCNAGLMISPLYRKPSRNEGVVSSVPDARIELTRRFICKC